MDANILGIDINKTSEEESDVNDETTLGEAELRLIKTALERTNRNVSKAARAVSYTHLTLPTILLV